MTTTRYIAYSTVSGLALAFGATVEEARQKAAQAGGPGYDASDAPVFGPVSETSAVAAITSHDGKGMSLLSNARILAPRAA